MIGEGGIGDLSTGEGIFLVLYFLHKMNKIINSNPTTDPTAIPAIAPPERLLLSLVFEQETRGSPHREVPKKDSAEKLFKRHGINPVKRLKETLNCLRLLSPLKSGSDPVNWLFSKYNVLKLIRLLNPDEKSPEKLFLAKFTRTRLVKVKKLLGISSEKLLPCK